MLSWNLNVWVEICFFFQDQEGDMPDVEVAGDLNRTSQTNGSDEWTTRVKPIKLIFNTDYL